MPHDRDASNIAELAITVDALAQRLEAAEMAIRALQNNEKNIRPAKQHPDAPAAPLTR